MQGTETAENIAGGGKVFRFAAEDGSFSCISKRVSPDGLETTIYPFGFDGTAKFNSVTEIVVRGTRDWPIGLRKAAKSGYGFTTYGAPILDALEAKMPELKRLVLVKDGLNRRVSNRTVQLTIADFEATVRRLTSDISSKRKDTLVLSGNLLADHLPTVCTKNLVGYSAGDLASFLQNRDTSGAKFSADDIAAMAKVIKESNVDFGATGTSIELAGRVIDRILVEDIVRQYKRLLDRKTKSRHLEDDWQEFLEKYVLFLRLGYIQKVAKVSLPGWGVKLPDFLMIDMQHYVDVMEIKTHLTQVLQFDDSRKNFYWAPEVAKAISQVHVYVDLIHNHRTDLTTVLHQQYGVDVLPEAIRPRALILVGCSDHMAGPRTAGLPQPQRKKMLDDFRRLRTTLVGIEVMLFDELLASLVNVLNVLGKQTEA